jgi:muramoyltetrapeptide carboxypeptidase
MALVNKPKALEPGAAIRVVAPASPAPEDAIRRGIAELSRLGYSVIPRDDSAASEGYFAASAASRARELISALRDPETRAVISTRGGYGSTYLIDALAKAKLASPKIFLGYSDMTALNIWLWQKHRWVTFYGPMAASGFDGGANRANGYDEDSFRRATSQTRGGWNLDLAGDQLSAGNARGVLLGGCLTLIRSTLGTPWELDTRGSILAIEDVGIKPYAVDRALTHLRQAGKFKGVRGIILGEFPESAPPVAGGPTVREVCARILGDLKIPIVWGARFGHTPRAMLTFPLGVRARLDARATGTLEILEPAVTIAARKKGSR